MRSKTLNNRFTVPTWILVGMVSLLVSCGDDNTGDVARNYKLVWSDEFIGNSGDAPNPENWVFDIGTGQNGWGNAELQYYTDRAENVMLDGDGNLVITAREESFQGRAYTSARIKTKDLFEQRYGRFEARIKTPFGPGMWPAFWMLGQNIDEVSWPRCGEIDIMELRGQFPTKIACSIHGPGYSGGSAITRDFELDNARFDIDFHVFAVEWGENFIEFFVDGIKYQTITPANANGQWVFDQPFFMLLNLAVGGNYVGPPNASTQFPQKLTIDYVRVYQEVQQ